MLYSTLLVCIPFFFFFFNDTATTEIYTLSLHDALPIWLLRRLLRLLLDASGPGLKILPMHELAVFADRSEEHSLNSSHVEISYAVFCLKKKTIKLDSRTTYPARTPLTN